ncbi:MAG: ATP-dependent DNA helicase RecQ [Spirochaetaceae bacterium]|nr:ATP-dependent DNA helicase RecQ [Spirochaetaceae bacterium]
MHPLELDDDRLDRPCAERDTALEAALARLGHAAFRPGQREAIESLLDARRALLVAPTGGGKSLCYQLPSLLLRGTTVVVSPLIALMRDQVDALERLGVEATFLASTLEPQEMAERLDGLEAGRWKLVYVAPERLVFPRFRDILRRIDCPLFAIDEAHCISEWGHDFRPEYLEIGRVLAEHPDARVLACTATATPYVRDEIIARLGLPADTPQLVRGFARPNLALRVAEVERASERRRAVDETLAEALGAPGAGRGCAIVYGPTRKSTEAERDRLVGRGWRCESYHAGLTAERREEVHAAFASGELEVVVATNAFGMGIDRADVRAVIHLAPPGSIEAYYQEVGRAGRDGRDAIGQMLVGPGDLARRRALIEADGIQLGGGSEGPAAEAARHRWALFLELMRFAEGGSCRHDTVLRYFGDEEETLAGCGRCDVCEELAASGRDGARELANDESAEDVTLIVRKALSGVARIHGRYGLGAAVALLRGQDDARLRGTGLDRTTTWGVLSERTEVWLTRLLRRCVTAGWVDLEGGDRPIAMLTETGVAVMRGERPVRLLLPREKNALPRARGAASGPSYLVRRAGESVATRRSAGADETPLDAGALARFEALRAWRLEAAREGAVPPYVVASDRALREIALIQPTRVEDLTLAHGIGEGKAARYGEEILRVLRELDGATG